MAIALLISRRNGDSDLCWMRNCVRRGIVLDGELCWIWNCVRWEIVLVGNCVGGELCWWGIVLDGELC
jgi:hypothetical protein